MDVAIYDLDGNFIKPGLTNEKQEGSYSISNLHAGDYKVHFSCRSCNYAPEWYDGKGSFETADPVNVTAGQTISGVNGKLLPEAVSPPITLSGPTSGTEGVTYTYSTGGSSSTAGHPLQYRFGWGDGTNSEWLPLMTVVASKSWSSAGTYKVKAQARCASDTSVTSDWSSALQVTICVEAVSIPNTPNGPVTGTTGKSYTYSTGGSTSSMGHSVEYQFDWKGDGLDLSAWGSSTQSKTWTVSGIYKVRARARCTTDTSVVSNWSDSLSIAISLPDISVTPPAYDFGIVKMKRNKRASLLVKNSGTANLSISGLTVTGKDASMFAITSGTASKTIKPRKTLAIKVAFKPTSTGSKSAILRITSNDPDAPTVDIPLSGTGQ